MIFLELSFLDVTLWDVLDVLIVGILIFQLYRLLKGSVGLYIFIGVVVLYLVWWVVRALDMDLLTVILNQFVSVGVLMLVVIFQQEIRKFLLFLGESAVKNRQFSFIQKLIPQLNSKEQSAGFGGILLQALNNIKNKKEGALIVLSKKQLSTDAFHSGLAINADLSANLIEAIFQKNGPLHDGALIIEGEKIAYARCVLPVSDQSKIPSQFGLRHRAAIGISEIADVFVIVLSEERGQISTVKSGQIKLDLSDEDLIAVLEKWYKMD